MTRGKSDILNYMDRQKGFGAIIFVFGIVLTSLLIIGGALYLKSTRPDLLNKILSNKGSSQQANTNNIIQTVQNLTQSSGQNLPVAQNIFGFNTFQTLLSTDANKNIFISPSSIALALLMAYNGAGTDTKTAMENVLAIKGMSKTDVDKASLDLINTLKSPDQKVEVDIANSIWARQGKVFNQDFLNTNQQYFQAKVTSLDFDSPSAVNTINSWVSDNTKGKIPTIISHIPPDARMYLINAIYFKGTWDIEFDKKLTRDRQFTSYNNQKKMVSMMEQHQDNFSYLENDDFQAVSLPYGSNNSLSMYVFLPKEGSLISKKDFNTFAQTLNQQNWDTWIEQFRRIEGTVILPKFKVEYSKELKDTLTALGMGIAFTGNADFEGIFHQAVISQVLHKTYIDVGEEGTEAAAVTEIGVALGAAPGVHVEKKTFYMEVNRPFFYAIRDNRTGTILFMGTVQEL